MTVVGEAENGRRAVELTGKLDPQIVVMDITMSGLNGIEATRQIKSSAPRTEVIALSIHSDRRFVIEMLRAGASGYLLKDDCTRDELARAIHAVAEGHRYVSPGIADVVVEEVTRRPADEDDRATPSLTPREREVLQLLAEGRTTKEIALLLKVSPKTVETHRHQIMERLGINSVAELTKWAVRHGLTSL